MKKELFPLSFTGTCENHANLITINNREEEGKNEKVHSPTQSGAVICNYIPKWYSTQSGGGGGRDM